MPHEKNNPFDRGETRRHFIKKTGAAAAAVAGASLLRLPISAATNQGSVAIVLDSSDERVKPAPVKWAADQLRDALIARGINVQFFASLDQVPPSQACVFVAGRGSQLAREVLGAKGISLPDTPESLALARGKFGNRAVLVAAGSDVRGLVYALLELADQVSFAGVASIASASRSASATISRRTSPIAIFISRIRFCFRCPATMCVPSRCPTRSAI